MPNWELTHKVKEVLRNRANFLAKRTLDYAQGDFPLSVETLQSMVLERDIVDDLTRIKSRGVRTITEAQNIRLAVLTDDHPNLRRGAVLTIRLPRPIFVPYMTDGYLGNSSTYTFSKRDKRYLLPDLDRQPVPEETRMVFYDWVSRAIRQYRLTRLVQSISNEILNEHAKTCAHLRRFWPTLATLINDIEGAGLNINWRNDTDFHKMWKDRFHSQRRPLGLYEPNPEARKKFAPLIHAADTVLTAGLLLAPYEANDSKVNAAIEAWQKIEGDGPF